MKRNGLTLLESMVALVILGLVVTGFLEVFQGSSRLARNAETWSTAVAYAEDGMELVKSGEELPREALPGGFERHVETQPWRRGIRLVTVIVSLPDGGRGGRVSLERLVEER